MTVAPDIAWLASILVFIFLYLVFLCQPATPWRDEASGPYEGILSLGTIRRINSDRFVCREVRNTSHICCVGASSFFFFTPVFCCRNKPLRTRHCLPYLVVERNTRFTAYKHSIDVSRSGWFRSYYESDLPSALLLSLQIRLTFGLAFKFDLCWIQLGPLHGRAPQ
jgi:hypothetical protein